MIHGQTELIRQRRNIWVCRLIILTQDTLLPGVFNKFWIASDPFLSLSQGKNHSFHCQIYQRIKTENRNIILLEEEDSDKVFADFSHRHMNRDWIMILRLLAGLDTLFNKSMPRGRSQSEQDFCFNITLEDSV